MAPAAGAVLPLRSPSPSPGLRPQPQSLSPALVLTRSYGAPRQEKDDLLRACDVPDAALSIFLTVIHGRQRV